LLAEARSPAGKWKARHDQVRDERDDSRKACGDLIRQQQEASFKQIQPGSWLPTEGSVVIADLGKIKRMMKS
jgi:hypothetical protein